jgi:hypothetical protein
MPTLIRVRASDTKLAFKGPFRRSSRRLDGSFDVLNLQGLRLSWKRNKSERCSAVDRCRCLLPKFDVA